MECDYNIIYHQSLLTITIHCQQVLHRGPMDTTTLIPAITHDHAIIGPMDQIEHRSLDIERIHDLLLDLIQNIV